MKKSALFISAFFAAATAFAMSYYGGKYETEVGERNIKWSKCDWGNNVNFETELLPGKPGSNDDVIVRPGLWTFEIDGNYNVSLFHTGDNSKSFAKGRTFKAKRKISLSLACSNSGISRQEWDRCTVDSGGPFEITFWHEARQAGKAILSLTDTKFNVKGDFVCTIPANPIIKNEARSGVEVILEGASDFNFNGGALIDSIIADQNEEWMFKWTFNEKGGKMPRVFFNRRAQFDKPDIEVNVSENLKPGKYGLAEFHDKRSGFTNIRSITLNGNEYKLGTEFKVGKNPAKLYLGAFGRDSKTPNDLILEVGK